MILKSLSILSTDSIVTTKKDETKDETLFRRIHSDVDSDIN